MIQLYNEDCIPRMRKFSDCSIDLTVTSPTYDKIRVKSLNKKDG